MKPIIPFMFSLSCLILSNTALADKLYKWVDDQGVTHYSEHPPLNTANEVIKPKTGHSDPVTYTPPAPAPVSAAEAKKAAEAEARAARKDPKRCAEARKNLETLKTFARIKIMGADGQYRYLTPDEQKQKLTESSKVVEESCD
jgi:hypothetical protein